MHSSIFTFLNSFVGKSNLFDALVIVGARYFQYIVILYAMLLMYRELVSQTPNFSPFRNFKKVFTEGFWVGSSVILAMGITYILKYSLAVPRPFLAGANALFIHGGYNSFPSGHATFFAALALSMFFYHKKRGWWFLISAVIIGVSRIISGVHYPIDIICGYIVGIASAYFVIKIFRPWVKKNIFKIEQ